MPDDLKELLKWAWTLFGGAFLWAWKLRKDDLSDIKQEHDKMWTAINSKATDGDMQWQRENIKTLFEKQEGLKEHVDVMGQAILSEIRKNHLEAMQEKHHILLMLERKADK